VLVWFVVCAPILVAEVFRSPMVDYRMVVLGAVLPLVEVVTGAFLGLHTLALAVVSLAVAMAATTGHRLVRRRLLGLPIGLFCHLVLDGTWARTRLFWWPAFGLGTVRPPEAGRSLAWGILLDLGGLVLGWWAWRRYDLADRANRRHLVRTGHLARGVLG
jgi:hypothetical protein